MSTQTKTKSKSQKNNGASSIVWFEIPADNVERARTFYGKLFGWKIDRVPGSDDKTLLAHRYRRRRCLAQWGNDGAPVSGPHHH